jgi:hypothetical protein
VGVEEHDDLDALLRGSADALQPPVRLIPTPIEFVPAGPARRLPGPDARGGCPARRLQEPSRNHEDREERERERHEPDHVGSTIPPLARGREPPPRSALWTASTWLLFSVTNLALERPDYLPGVDAYIEELIVTSAHRRRSVIHAHGGRRGVGERMRALVLSLLDTHVTNTDARLYGALGYREIGAIFLK